MAAKYPSIPDPTLDPSSLRDSVLAMKQAIEILTGQRGDKAVSAVTFADLPSKGGKVTDPTPAIAANTAAIATNTADITTNTADIAALTPTVAKAWVKFSGRGTNGVCAVAASYNVSGVTRIATGEYTVTFSTAFSSADYVVSACALIGSSNSWVEVLTMAAGSLNIGFLSSNTTLVDPTSGMLVFFGDQ